jgi:hypothetical protein
MELHHWLAFQEDHTKVAFNADGKTMIDALT